MGDDDGATTILDALGEDGVAALEKLGERRHVAAGSVLFEPGDELTHMDIVSAVVSVNHKRAGLRSPDRRRRTVRRRLIRPHRTLKVQILNDAVAGLVMREHVLRVAVSAFQVPHLEAVDLVDANGKVARKGHYRITRSSLNLFLESKKVRPLPNQVTHSARSRRLPKVKNHLGL